jgi:hypothetical protein
MKGIWVSLPAVILTFLATSCTKPIEEERNAILPADSIISEPVMVQLLADVHILEAGLLVKRNHGQKIGGISSVWYADLFKKYKISEDRFRLNLQYYQWDTGEYNALYAKVIAEIKSRNEWIPSAPAAPKKDRVK